jgi:hypothetical protein
MTETILSLTNSCTCIDENDAPFDCGGDCFRDDAALIVGETARWVTRNPSDHGYLIEGTGMGWTKASGELDWDGREPLHEAIGIRGDWHQRYAFRTHEIQIKQSHHDAAGEHYTVRAKSADEA